MKTYKNVQYFTTFLDFRVPVTTPAESSHTSVDVKPVTPTPVSGSIAPTLNEAKNGLIKDQYSGVAPYFSSFSDSLFYQDLLHRNSPTYHVVPLASGSFLVQPMRLPAPSVVKNSKSKRSRRKKRAIVQIKNKMTTVGENGNVDGEVKIEHIENSRIAVSKTGPAGNGDMPAQVPSTVATSTTQSQPQSVHIRNIPGTHIIYDDLSVPRQTRQIIRPHTPRYESTFVESRTNPFSSNTRVSYGHRHHYPISHNSHETTWTSDTMYQEIYDKLYQQLYGDVEYFVDHRLSRQRSRSRRDLSSPEFVESLFEDNGNIPKDDTSRPPQSYISISNDQGRLDVIHIPSNHTNATEPFSLTFSEGILTMSAGTVSLDTFDGKDYSNTSIFISQINATRSQNITTLPFSKDGRSALVSGKKYLFIMLVLVVGFTCVCVIGVCRHFIFRNNGRGDSEAHVALNSPLKTI